MSALTPRPYQITGRDFLAGRSRALLADEMRVGKTPQAILAAHKAGAQSMLVLCPAIAVPQWCREIERWWPDGNLPKADVLSYDRARTLWQSEDNYFAKAGWDVMVVDEAHFCKNPKAQRTKMVYGKGGLAHQAGATWALSGTPAPKHAAELWPMLRAFGATSLTYDAFVDHFCAAYYNKHFRTKVIKGTREDRMPELREMLAQVMLRRTRAEVAPDMPAIGFNFLEVEPQTAFDLSPPPGISDDELLAWVESNSGCAERTRQAVAEAKVDALIDEIVFELDSGLLKQTVVFGWHTAPLQRLAWQMNQRGYVAETITGETSPKKREAIQKSFREGKTQVLVANILAAGTAIDLSAASHGYFLELDWVPGNNMQAANRLVSMQKKEPVTFDVVTWRGSVDDRIQQVLVKRVSELNQFI